MHKVSDVLAERFSQDPLETYFQHFSKPKSIQAKATGKVSDENINFESDRISSMSEKIQTKHSLLSSKVSSNHQIPSYQTNTTCKLNEYIYKLTYISFTSFCQPFHIPFFYNIVCFVAFAFVLLLQKTFSTGT